jgi:nuclear pore complex protein Nup107
VRHTMTSNRSSASSLCSASGVQKSRKSSSKCPSHDASRSQLTPPSHRAQGKVNTKPIKELLENITTVFDGLIPSLAVSYESDTPDSLNLKRAYIPEIIITYLSVLQTASFLLHRETAINAMEIANLVADPNNAWLADLFLATGRMSELVQTLAKVSQAMLNLNEFEGKKKETKKRGSKGETLRIWDLNAYDRV